MYFDVYNNKVVNVCFSLPKEPEPFIRSQTVVLRRSNDAEKQESAEGRETIENQQDVQDQSVARSKTVLLKQSVDQDKQANEQEIKGTSLDPPGSAR